MWTEGYAVRGLEDKLQKGAPYKILDIQNGTFEGDHYIQVQLPNNKTLWCHRHRFTVSKETCKWWADVKWRQCLNFSRRT